MPASDQRVPKDTLKPEALMQRINALPQPHRLFMLLKVMEISAKERSQQRPEAPQLRPGQSQTSLVKP